MVPTFLRVCQSGTWKNVGVVRVEIVLYIYIYGRGRNGVRGGVDSCESRVLQKSVCRQIVLINQGGTDVWRVSDKKSVYDETGETRVDASWSHSKQNYPINTRLTLF